MVAEKRVTINKDFSLNSTTDDGFQAVLIKEDFPLAEKKSGKMSNF